MASIFNTVEVSTGRVARIFNFLDSAEDFFVAIGKPTPWDSSFGLNISDINPPTPPITATEILEPIIYKRIRLSTAGSSEFQAKAASVSAACSDFQSNETNLSAQVLVQETLAQQNYTLYNKEELVDPNTGLFIRNPEFVYVSGNIIGEDYTTDEWRASALYTKLFFAPGVNTNLELYTPQQVTGGLLHHLTYNTPVERQDGKIHKFEYLINV